MKLLDSVRVLDRPTCWRGHSAAMNWRNWEPMSLRSRFLGADPELNRRLMGASFLAQNAGKRSVTINLKSPLGKEIFRRLATTVDVIVENFRPWRHGPAGPRSWPPIHGTLTAKTGRNAATS